MTEEPLPKDAEALVPASPASVSATGSVHTALPLIERFEDLDRDTILSIIEGADRRSTVAKWAFIGGVVGYIGATLVGMAAGWSSWIGTAFIGLYGLFALSYFVANRRGYTSEANSLGVAPSVVKRLVKGVQRVGRGMPLKLTGPERMGALADGLMRLVEQERRAVDLARLVEASEEAASDESS